MTVTKYLREERLESVVMQGAMIQLKSGFIKIPQESGLQRFLRDVVGKKTGHLGRAQACTG